MYHFFANTFSHHPKIVLDRILFVNSEPSRFWDLKLGGFVVQFSEEERGFGRVRLLPGLRRLDKFGFISGQTCSKF